MKQSVQQFITLMVLKLNALKSHIDAIWLQALDTFVSKTDADAKYRKITDAVDATTLNGKSATQIESETIATADTLYRKLTDAVDAATLNGKTAAQIEADAQLAAASLVGQLKDAFHQGIRNFVVVPFANAATFDFATLLTSSFGALNTSDADGSYAIHFLNGSEGKATITNVHASAGLPSDTGTVENQDILYVKIANGAISNVTLYSDPDTDALLALQSGVSALQAAMAQSGANISTINTTIANLVNQVGGISTTTNANASSITTLQGQVQTIIDGYITSADFDGMKAYVTANITF